MKKFISGFLLGGMLMLSGLAYADTFVFNDINGDEWYANSVSRLYEKGIVEGYSDNTYGPSNSVNRAELAAMLDRELNYMLAYDLAHNMLLWSFNESTPQEIYLDGTVIVESTPNAGGYSDPTLAEGAVEFLAEAMADVNPEDVSFCKEAFNLGLYELDFACDELGEITTTDTEFGVE